MFFIKTPFLLKKCYTKRIWKIPNQPQRLFLTFDDGPTPGITEWILEILKKYEAKATFFCVGKNIEQHYTLYQKIIHQQHAIGNHSYNHLNGWKTTAADYLEDINRCQQLTKTLLFRPPYGKIKKKQVARLHPHFKIIMWDVLSGDFSQHYSEKKCLKNVLKNTVSGSIIVFHDSKKAEKKLRYVLPSVLEHFRKEGFSFEKISY